MRVVAWCYTGDLLSLCCSLLFSAVSLPFLSFLWIFSKVKNRLTRVRSCVAGVPIVKSLARSEVELSDCSEWKPARYRLSMMGEANGQST